MTLGCAMSAWAKVTIGKRHVQVLSCKASVRKKIAIRMPDAMMPLNSVSL